MKEISTEDEKLHAAIYCRVSTKKQEDSESLAYQIKKCKQFCEMKEFSYDVYEDVKSGATSNREDYQQLIEDIKNSNFNVIVVSELSRISRNFYDFAEFLKVLETEKISFVAIKEGFDSSTGIGDMFIKIAAVFAEYERKQLMERVKDRAYARAKDGVWLTGRPAFGYRYDKNTKQILVNDAEAIIVKRIFSEFVSGKNRNEIASFFNLERNHVDDILKNEFYTGLSLYGKTTKNKTTSKILKINGPVVRENYHPAIIDSATFQTAQHILNISYKKKVPASENPNSALGGLAKCYCGNAMYFHKPAKNRSGYYQCSGRTCRKRSENAPLLEKLILEELLKLQENPNVLNIESERDKNLDLINDKKTILHEIKEVKEELLDLLDMYLPRAQKSGNSFSKEILDIKHDKLQSSLSSLELELKVINDKLSIKDDVVINKDLFFKTLENISKNDSSRMELKRIFNILIDKIQFENDFEFKIYYNI